MEPLTTESVYNTIYSPVVPKNQPSGNATNGQLQKTVCLNSIVEYSYNDGSKPIRVQIVSPEKEDLGMRKVSCVAPISKALLNHKEGDCIVRGTASGAKKVILITKVDNRLAVKQN